MNRLISGEAKNRTLTFDVKMTLSTFHVGNTNVDYFTSCTETSCTTIFKAFVGDGFWDPIDLGVEVGGTPYKYNTWQYQITYKNPGYPVGVNIK